MGPDLYIVDVVNDNLADSDGSLVGFSIILVIHCLYIWWLADLGAVLFGNIRCNFANLSVSELRKEQI